MKICQRPGRNTKFGRKMDGLFQSIRLQTLTWSEWLSQTLWFSEFDMVVNSWRIANLTISWTFVVVVVLYIVFYFFLLLFSLFYYDLSAMAKRPRKLVCAGAPYCTTESWPFFNLYLRGDQNQSPRFYVRTSGSWVTWRQKASSLRSLKAWPNQYSHTRTCIYTELNAYLSLYLLDVHLPICPVDIHVLTDTQTSL